jgi:hypothetical protein
MDIFTFSGQSLLAWTAAYAILEPASFILIPKISKAQTTQEYYKQFPIPIVVFGDFIYSTFLFLIAQQVIGLLFNGLPPKTILQWSLRFLTFVAVQWTGDISFFTFLTNLKPQQTNKYINFFQRYGKDVNLGAPIGDSIYGLAWFILAQFMLLAPIWLQTTLITAFLFGTLVVSY